jgi:hypothetical protein
VKAIVSVLVWCVLLAIGTTKTAAARPLSSNDSRVLAPDDAPGDGIYGRFDGDFSFTVAAGGEIDITRQSARPALFTTLRFYQTVGLSLSASQAVTGSDPLERRVTLSFIVEPLFLVRWPKYQHTGHPFWDLTLDSLQLHVGAAFLEPRAGNFASPTVANMGAGLGFPLLAKADGLWLRTRLDVELGAAAPAVLGLLGLEWQFFVESPWLAAE